MCLGQTLGSVFAFARESRGIPLDQAAHETRIRIQCLRDLEGDNLSHLSPAYARLFIMDYAKYLGIPIGTIKDRLPEAGGFGTQGYEYIKNAPGACQENPRTPKSRGKKSRTALACLAVVLAFIGGFQAYAIWRKIDRIKTPQLTLSENRIVPSFSVPKSETAPPVQRAESPEQSQGNQEPMRLMDQPADSSIGLNSEVDQGLGSSLATTETL